MLPARPRLRATIPERAERRFNDFSRLWSARDSPTYFLVENGSTERKCMGIEPTCRALSHGTAVLKTEAATRQAGTSGVSAIVSPERRLVRYACVRVGG